MGVACWTTTTPPRRCSTRTSSKTGGRLCLLGRRRLSETSQSVTFLKLTLISRNIQRRGKTVPPTAKKLRRRELPEKKGSEKKRSTKQRKSAKLARKEKEGRGKKRRKLKWGEEERN